ncbi:MAG: SpoIIE family protein phosphatase [Polyangiaceae bacterium]|nr:SpoIIE family protein phosphatase [Polyangiaceae bacterium]MCB9605391.1 SpoIIE family protein phosphatase [Polyangiaceae bacterium]
MPDQPNTAPDDAIATMKVGVCVWELEEPNVPASLRLVVCNESAAKFMSVKREDVLGKRIHDGFPGSEKMPLAGIFTKVVETAQGMLLGDVPYVDEVIPDSVFSIHAHYQGKRRCCVEFTNVTEQRKAEREVAAKHDELTRALNELWSEMDLARKIQTVLLPSETNLDSYEVAASMRPASTVGGDYYDVVHTKSCPWLLIGDVSGHGVSAGLIMMMVQTAVRTALVQSDGTASPSRLLAQVAAAVQTNLARIGQNQYMTISALKLNGGRVQYAGLHQDVVVFRAATGTVEAFESKGVWLGVVDQPGDLLEDSSIDLDVGDVLLLFSDGLTEARVNGELFGQDRMVGLFKELAAANQSCAAITQALLDAVGSDELADDQTVVVARRLAERGE